MNWEDIKLLKSGLVNSLVADDIISFTFKNQSYQGQIIEDFYDIRCIDREWKVVHLFKIQTIGDNEKLLIIYAGQIYGTSKYIIPVSIKERQRKTLEKHTRKLLMKKKLLDYMRSCA